MKILKKTQKANISRKQQPLFFRAKQNNMINEKNTKNKYGKYNKTMEENRQKLNKIQ